ncbi:Mrtf, partial [Drosophila busckii]
SVSSCSSSSSNSCSRSKSVSTATAQRLLNKSTATATATASPHKSLSRTLKATQRAHNSSPKVGHLVKSASLHSLSSGSSSSSSSSNSNSVCTSNGGSGSALLATISTSPLTTVEVFSSASCNGLLATRLSGKALEHTFQDIILLHEAYDEMSEGEQRLHATFLSSSDDGNNSDCYEARQSPPKAIVDSSPLQPAMDKNKESLKTSPAIHEQCKQLERAKTSDLLKAKIQQRPNREDLERLHILEEDECHIDPSLAEKQRMLKKARLADQLNSQIQHRPGPLELIKKNILHTEKPIEKIVKEGLVPFKATSEGLLTRPQHPHSYVTYEEDSQSSESDTRQTPPRLDELMPTAPAAITEIAAAVAEPLVSPPKDLLQAAAASAGIVTVALTTPTTTPSNGGQLVLSLVPSIQLLNTTDCCKQVACVPPPPPPPMPMSGCIKVKQETANLFEELVQSVAGPTASPASNHIIPMLASPCSLGSTTSTLSPLSSIASPPPPPTRLHLQPVSVKSDAPGKDKNRKKSKSKPVSKARTIKFHEYKGPPSAAGQAQDQTQPEETSYQLLLEQQNYLLKFLENLNKNQSILPSASAAAATASSISCTSNSITVTTKTVPALTTCVSTAATPATITLPAALPNTISITSSTGAAPVSFGDATMLTAPLAGTPTPPTLSLIATTQPTVATVAAVQQQQQHPPPLPSPALSISSSIPPSPATSFAESTSSFITDLTRLEKMKVSDLKQHLKRRNLPVSGPKPQLIERLKPYLPLEPLECCTPANTPASATEVITISDAMDTSNSEPQQPPPVAMLVTESPIPGALEHEQMDVVQQLDNSHAMTLQTILPPQPQTATIIQNEELLRRQQRKIDELQRQLQRSQQELQQIRRQQQQQTVTAQVVNGLPSQQITLITTTTTANGPQQTLTMLPQLEKSIPAKEPSTSPAPPAATLRKPTGIKSEQVSDVLDILIKQGELPESAALEPITPLTPLPELSLFNGVTPTTAAGGASIVPLVPKLEAPATPQSLPNLEMAMDTNDSHVNFASNQPAGYIENINMASPLQPDVGSIDAESVAKTLDIFLEQHHATPPPSTPPKCNSSSNGGISGVGVGVGVGVGNVDKPNSPDAKLNHFDEYELLELMSQQLEMDIGDDSNNYCSGKSNSSNNNLNLNRSLQPSINELLDASSPQSVLLNNNHSADVDFDADSFVAQLSQHVAGGSNHSGSNSSGANGNSNCNNILISTNGCGMGVDCSTSNGHYSGTPMEVCDDLESTFNSIMQAVNQQPSSSIHGDYASTAAGSNSSNSAMDSGGAVDAFNASGDIFDLFNIDDYKMSWAAGDFTV